MTRRSVTDEQLGRLCRRLSEVVRRVDEGAISYDRTMEILQALIEGKSPRAIPQTFKVLVDYTQPLEEMIEEGNYDWVNPNITENHFPLQEQDSQEVEIYLFHFKRTMSSKEAEKEMEKAGFRPATLPELLALGRDYPDLQKQFLIAALGSVWRHPAGSSDTPLLEWDGGGRDLGLHWLEGDWRGGCRFAAVRK